MPYVYTYIHTTFYNPTQRERIDTRIHLGMQPRARLCLYIRMPVQSVVYTSVWTYTCVYECMATRVCIHVCVHACVYTCTVRGE